LQIAKRSGVLEPFSRTKIVNGVRKACQGRPVTEDDLAVLAERVEDAIRALGNPEVAANAVGLAILGPLRELDEVAYLRFASVYRNFDSLEDFEAEVAMLRVERDAAAATASEQGAPVVIDDRTKKSASSATSTSATSTQSTSQQSKKPTPNPQI